MEIRNWENDLKFGKDNEKLTEDEKILKFFPECKEIIPSTLEEDKKKGIDRFIILENGKSVSIDIKTRREGAIKFWKNVNNPDITLELWSVMDPNNLEGKKIGWTLNDNNQVDYILFQFEDITDFYLIPFQLLKLAFKKNKEEWINIFKTNIQESMDYDIGNKWKSEHIYIPVDILWKSIVNISNKGGII